MLMFIRNLGGPDLLIILAIVVLLFGATKLPELARGMGRSIRIFRSEMNEAEKEKQDSAEAAKPAELNAAPETKAQPTTETHAEKPPTA